MGDQAGRIRKGGQQAGGAGEQQEVLGPQGSLLKNLAFGSTAALYLVLSALAGLWVWPLPSYSRALLVGLLWALLWLFLDWQAFGVGMGLRSFFGSQPLSDLVLVVDSLLAVSLAWWWRPRRRLMR